MLHTFELSFASHLRWCTLPSSFVVHFRWCTFPSSFVAHFRWRTLPSRSPQDTHHSYSLQALHLHTSRHSSQQTHIRNDTLQPDTAWPHRNSVSFGSQAQHPGLTMSSTDRRCNSDAPMSSSASTRIHCTMLHYSFFWKFGRFPARTAPHQRITHC